MIAGKKTIERGTERNLDREDLLKMILCWNVNKSERFQRLDSSSVSGVYKHCTAAKVRPETVALGDSLTGACTVSGGLRGEPQGGWVRTTARHKITKNDCKIQDD